MTLYVTGFYHGVCLLVEAEYTFQMRKEYIPLMVQKRYRPDGWLGMILGAKLYFDFSGKYPFEKPWNGLMKELKGMGRLSVLENNALGQYMSTGVNVYRCTCLQVYMNMSVSLLGVKRWKWLSVLYWRFVLFSFWCEIISQPVRNSVMFNLIVTLLLWQQLCSSTSQSKRLLHFTSCMYYSFRQDKSVRLVFFWCRIQ